MKYITHNALGAGYEIPAGALLLWGGASAPAGFSFETALDDYFVMGNAAADLVTARGELTHFHTNPGAEPVAGHNNHVILASATSSSGGDTNVYKFAQTNFSPIHSHTATGSNESTAGGHGHTLNETDPASNLPPYRRLRWIKSATPQEAPIGSIVMQNTLNLLSTDWAVCDGNNGTYDMQDYFVYSGGADGSETGGSETHKHTNSDGTSTDGEHTHTVDLTTNTVGDQNRSTAGEVAGVAEHHHTATGAVSAPGGAHKHNLDNTSSESSLPPYIVLQFWMRII